MIYLVEDDESIRELVIYTLKSQGFEAKGFERPSHFWKAMEKEEPALLLLDVMLPEEDGISILKKLRMRPDTRKLPIIMLTAKSSEYDTVVGLDSGADDYIPKPFDMPVLLCKVAAVLRRTGKCETETDKMICCGDLRLDAERYRAYCGDTELELTTKEFELLRVFMENPGRVFTRQRLLDLVWGMNYFGDERIVDTHIKNLRKKLDRDVIRTVRGVGYRLEKKGEEKA